MSKASKTRLLVELEKRIGESTDAIIRVPKGLKLEDIPPYLVYKAQIKREKKNDKE